MLLTLDLIGTFVFALSGASSGVKRRLDLFGVLVLAFAAGNLGGITRDLLIGATPPAAISDWRYLGVSLLAGVITFLWPSSVDREWNPVLVFDGAGLALFAVSGAQKALSFGLPPVMAALLGMLTGVGGGMARDVPPSTAAGISPSRARRTPRPRPRNPPRPRAGRNRIASEADRPFPCPEGKNRHDLSLWTRKP